MKKIVIADDSATARKFIRRCFEIAGCQGAEWTEAEDGNFAFSALSSVLPDLLITDLNMPNLDGEQLLRKVRADDRFKTLTVIVITSIKNPAKEKELLNLGAAAILPKPVSPAVVAKTLKAIAITTKGAE